MKKLNILLIVSVVAGTACWPFGDDALLAEMTIRRQSGGVVTIVRGSQQIPVTNEDVPVQPGDVIRTTDDGVANLRLEGDRQAWIAQVGDSRGGTETRILGTDGLDGRSGTIVAAAIDPMRVRFGDVVAGGGDAIFRIDQYAGAARAASYDGTVRLTAPGEAAVEMDRLHEVQASAGDLRTARPYQLDPNDPFDRRELAAVITLQAELDVLGSALQSQLGRQRPSLDYFEVLADRNVDAMKPFLRRPPADLLTAFTIATNTDASPFATAIKDAFALRDDGGEWGVVAAILRSNPRLLLADLNDIIVATGAVAGGQGDTAEFTLAAAEAADEGTTISEPPPDSDDGDNGDDGNNGGNGGGGGDEEPPEEPQECTSGPECDVQKAEKEIRDRLGGDPSPSPSPSNLVDGSVTLEL